MFEMKETILDHYYYFYVSKLLENQLISNNLEILDNISVQISGKYIIYENESIP